MTIQGKPQEAPTSDTPPKRDKYEQTRAAARARDSGESVRLDRMTGLLHFCARVFEFGPVTASDVADLGRQLGMLLRYTPEIETGSDLFEKRRTERQVGLLLHRLVRPYTRWDRLVWRWRGNPFLGCTRAEYLALVNAMLDHAAGATLTQE